jgi:hypothetical protein
MSACKPGRWTSGRRWAAAALALLVGATLGVVALPASPASAVDSSTVYFMIRNAQSNRCLDAEASTINQNGTKIQLWDCQFTPNQQWYMDGEFIRNRASNRCLDADTNNTGNGGRVQLWDCHGGVNHRWFTTGSYIRTRLSTGRCLDAEAGSIGNNGTRIQQYDCLGGNNQKWRQKTTVYFVPPDGASVTPQDAFVAMMPPNSWIVPPTPSGIPTCSTDKMVNVPGSDAGMPVTQLTGWSLGRLGPIYYLKKYPGFRANIDQIVMIDPGNRSDLDGCDKYIGAKDVLYDWLKANPRARLVIYSGDITGQNWHQGIQEIYFPRIKADPATRTRAIVCNYTWSHTAIMERYDEYLDKPAPEPGLCPNGGGYWNP